MMQENKISLPENKKSCSMKSRLLFYDRERVPPFPISEKIQFI